MRPEAKNYLAEALRAAKDICAFVPAQEIGRFGTSEIIRSAVYMKFIVIGEMLTRLRDCDEATFDQISESWRIVGFRHQIAHGYGEMDDAITRRILAEKVPVLITEIKALLEN